MVNDVRALRKALIETVKPFYATNDLAHRLDHAHAVAENTLMILGKLSDIEASNELVAMALTASYYHDIHADKRDEHHILSAEHVRFANDAVLKIFTAEQREIIAQACAEHRASFKGEYSNRLSMVLNAADRGPLDFDKYFLRSYNYARTKCGKSIEESVWHAVDHSWDKFGPDGYAIKQPVWDEAYADSKAEFDSKLKAAYEALPSEFHSVEEAMEYVSAYRGFTHDLK